MADYIRGDQLTAQQRKEALNMYVHRHMQSSYPGDDAWLRSHSFKVKKDGHLLRIAAAPVSFAKNPVAPVARLPIGKKTKVNWIRQNRNGSITVSVAARAVRNPGIKKLKRRGEIQGQGMWGGLSPYAKGLTPRAAAKVKSSRERAAKKKNPTASDTAIRKWHDISVGFWKSLTDRQRGQLRMEYHAGVKKGRK